MNILLSNDDGYLAPGIRTLAAALDSLDFIQQLTVVAPQQNRSGASHSLTLEQPLRATTTDNGFICVNGTPTDCVHLGVTGLLETCPDMVVSGINAGSNLGDDVLYSGTVAAAMEGRTLGLPALAVSLVSHDPQHYDTAAKVIVQILQQMRTRPLPQDQILNINVPDVSWEQLKGMAVTRLGHRHKAEPAIQSSDPRGQVIYWVGPPGKAQDAGPGTDFYAIDRQQVSITPLHADLTRHQSLETLGQWFDKF
ncbi:5'/3'-nucleotidase SurE [Candidatus Venteria ishoeyi]|uniref:5'-nucleotidase SurE n=1 Tax=Candidatus Venteria ishoeyi TaxID=1899563 RepID=A0A1H6FAT1_9GAMM|nr:5'/3'-nucleotidase SurE [Candidatus Venteria ishoeyi]MDM8545336.1 5'/3'-nucleotidase SurE [Candidatus Venteria ishoeyi]SEH07220.1 5'-nucleotidase SurE [Candidatus Venteria ishoeyi]